MATIDILTQLKEFLLRRNTRSYSIIGTVLLLLLYGLEEVLEKMIPCPCTSTDANVKHVRLIFCFPAGILSLISLILHVETNQFYFIFCCKNETNSTNPERTPQNSGQSSNLPIECNGSNDKYRVCFYIWKFLFLFLKLFIAPIIWISILFLDGDYYACSQLMKSGEVDNITCAKFNCEGDSNRFLTGKQHLCEESRLVGARLLGGSLTTLLLLYLICYCFRCGENKYHYEYEYNHVYKNNETAITMKKITKRTKEKVNEELGEDISDKYPCIPKLSGNNENDAAESEQRQDSPSTPCSGERPSPDAPAPAVQQLQSRSGYSSISQSEEHVQLQTFKSSQ